MIMFKDSVLTSLGLFYALQASAVAAPVCNSGDLFPGMQIPVGDAPREVAEGDLDSDGDLDLVVANFLDDSITILFNNGSGSFDTELTLSPAGALSSPEGVSIADIDGDGHLDIAVANFGSASIALLLNDGFGVFSHAGNTPTGNQPKDVAIGLMNDDGLGDLVVVNSMDNTVSVLLNNGDLTFSTTPAITTVITPQRLALADMNKDGNLDTVLITDARVKVLDNDGDGLLTETASVNLSTGPRDLDVGDVDGDGDLDIVVANRNVDHSSLLTNNNDGTYTTSSILTGSMHRSVALTDTDNDGDLDLIAGDSINDFLRVLHNDGSGAFTPPELFYGGDNPWSIAAGDYDDDGIMDIAASNRNSDDLTTLFGHGDGSFVDQDTFDSGVGTVPYGVDVADVNGDGHIDFVIANRVRDTPDGHNKENIQLFLNQGDGTFDESVHFNADTDTDESVPSSVHFGDFDGLNGPDILIINTLNSVTLRRNNGSGTYFSEDSMEIPVGAGPLFASVDDFDNDGHLDFVTGNTDGDSISIMMNDGAGASFSRTDIFVGDNPFGVDTQDLNNDGFSDIVIGLLEGGTPNDQVLVYLADGLGSFHTPISHLVNESPRGITLGDVNGDSHPDIVAACIGSGDVFILLNDGFGQFTSAPNSPVSVGTQPIAAQIADVDNDGHMDIFVADLSDEQIHIMINDGAADFSEYQTFRTGGGHRHIAVADFDANGFPDLVTANDSTDSATVLLNNNRSIAYWSGPGNGFDDNANWVDDQSPALETHNTVIFDQTVGGFGPFPGVNLQSPVGLDSLGHATDAVTINMNGQPITLLGDPRRPFSAALELGLRQCGLGDALPATSPVLQLLNSNPSPATLSAPTVAIGTQGPAQFQINNPSNPVLLSVSDSLVVGDRADGNLFLSGPNSSVVYGNPLTVTDSVIIGYDADGVIELASGAIVNPSSTVDTDQLILGQELGSAGTILISGMGTEWNHTGSNFIIGQHGDGAIEVLNGGLLNTDIINSIALASEPGSSAYARVNGVDSLWHDPVGEINIGPGGDALLEATDGGVIDVFRLKNHSNGVIAGNSLINASVVNFGDLIVGDPNESNPTTAEALTIEGSLVQFDDPGNPQFSGRILLDIVVEDIEGEATILADQIMISQSASLAGSLIVSSQSNLENIQVKDVLVLITSGSPIGNARFDLALLPGLPDGKYFQIQYDAVPGFAGSVSLIVETFNEFALGDPSLFDPESSPTNAVAGDLNGDGYDDLALAIPDQSDPLGTDGQVVILLNAQSTQTPANWPGFVAGASLILQTDPNPTDVAIADLDQQHGNDLIVLSGTTGNAMPFISDGSADITDRFSVFPVLDFDSTSPQSIGVADFDTDGFPDVIVAGSTTAGSSAPGRVSVRLNAGTTGTWNGLDPVLWHSVVGVDPVDLAIDDLNAQDGADVAIANFGSDSVSIVANLGTDMGSWLGLGPANNTAVGTGPRFVFSRDLDEEKDLDLVSFNQTDESMSILIQDNPTANQLGQAFAPSASIPLGGQPISATFWDGDNDGDQDPAIVLLTSEGDRFVRLMRNLAIENPDAGLSFVLDMDIAQNDGPLLILSGQLNADDGEDLAIIGASTVEPLLGSAMNGTNTSNGSVYLGKFCSADLNDDSLLNFLDISIFLSEYANGSTLGDFNSDGAFNFLDISSFLASYGEGCP